MDKYPFPSIIQQHVKEMVSKKNTILFNSPEEVYKFLIKNKTKEELFFLHGDYCLPNVFIDRGIVTGFIDLGRAGIADKWQDIA